MKSKFKISPSKENNLQKLQGKNIISFIYYTDINLLILAISGLVFGSYLSLHIPTILSSHFGYNTFDNLLYIFR